MSTESAVPPYQPFPAQSARIPTSHSQVHLDNGAAHGSPRDNRSVPSPHLNSISREQSWPLESFTDLHLSGSEPRIFPGLVSRNHLRKSSMSETDGERKGKGSVRGGEGVVQEEEEEEAEEREREEVESDGGSN